MARTSQPWATSDLLSVSVDLPVLDVSYSRDPTMWGLVCVTSFTQHHVSLFFKIFIYLFFTAGSY